MTNLNPLKNTSLKGSTDSGKFFNIIKSGSRTNSGLGEALRKAKKIGFNNYSSSLSKKDLATFQGLIDDEIKNLPTHSSSLSYKARARIMQKADKLVKTGTISAEDKKDLQHIVKALGPDSSSPAMPTAPKKRASFFGRGSKNNQDTTLDPVAQKHIRADIKLEVSREMHDAAEDKAENKNGPKYHSASALGQYQTKRKLEQSKPSIASKGKKIDLTDINNLPDMDIG